ncbi:MAG: Multidrug resistance protein MdtA [Phycisphaerae bacterium]|nr:Multidrug resistance protein MdtA [Phycisphaerae bacterium]
MRRVSAAAGVVLLSCATGASLCGCESSVAAPETKPPAAAVPVRVARAVREDFEVPVGAIGWVEAFATVTVKPQVDGQIQEIHFREGDELRAGQPLFTIDPRPFEAALRLAKATLVRDQALAEDARLEAQRVLRLFENEEASERERDETRYAAESKIGQVEADQAMVDSATLDLEYCTIRAPFDGRAGSYMVHRGTIVKRNETELVMVNQIAPIYVAFSAVEHFMPDIRLALARGEVPVRARFDEEGGGEEWGRLSFVDNEVDRSTGMIRLKATFENQSRRLWPGRFMRVTMPTRTLPQVVVIPAAAVQPSQRGSVVYVVNADDTVETRAVTAGPTVTGRTAVTEGLYGDETVVTDGHLRLTPGATIERGVSATSQPTTRSASGESGAAAGERRS